ncbi:hypothetical protein JKY72_06245 [Candidatus Gracilibacteria bacterium]|nr:hypothetical protein [Candidatus Gracilibacteria bacterium]
MANTTFEIMKRKQKFQIKLFGGLLLFVFLFVSIFTFVKWRNYSFIKASIDFNETSIEILKNDIAESKSSYDEAKPHFKEIDGIIESKLASIFPDTDDYTMLTRQIDLYEEELSKKKGSIFEISNINYQSPADEENFSVLPFRMSIRSSADSFTEFLHLVENSGALNDKVRLMDLSSVRLNFEDGKEDIKIINFTVQINAYFQKKV